MTGPIVFVAAGVLLCNGPWAVGDVAIESHSVHRLAEVTLALLLFADAARINPQDLRRHAGLPTRLLAVGLPLTFALGAGLAAALLTDLPWELAALLGAVLGSHRCRAERQRGVRRVAPAVHPALVERGERSQRRHRHPRRHRPHRGRRDRARGRRHRGHGIGPGYGRARRPGSAAWSSARSSATSAASW